MLIPNAQELAYDTTVDVCCEADVVISLLNQVRRILVSHKKIHSSTLCSDEAVWSSLNSDCDACHETNIEIPKLMARLVGAAYEIHGHWGGEDEVKWR